MAPRLKQDYPALIAEYERRIAAGESLQEVKRDFTARGINFGTFDNQRRAFKKKTPQEPAMNTQLDPLPTDPVTVLDGQLTIEDADTEAPDPANLSTYVDMVPVSDLDAVSTSVDIIPTREVQTLAHYEQIIAQGIQTFIDVGHALKAIRDQQLYAQDYQTFEAYMQERWGMSRPRGYQLIGAAEVVDAVSTSVDIIPMNEAQARPLTTLSPEQQREVWQQVVETAPAGKVTAAHVKNTVKRLKPGTTTPTVAKPKALTPEPQQPARQRVQDGLFGVLAMVNDEDAWAILGEIALALNTYAERHEEPNLMQCMEQALSPLWHLIEDHKPGQADDDA